MCDIWMDVDAALAEVPVNIAPLIDDTDFKSRETAVAYNAAGMDLVWNFVTPAGAYTQTAVTPTTAGTYDWAHQGDGMYSIEIPASGGASINNDTEGFGWFTGVATGVLPWRGPVIGFRAAGLNDLMVESAYSTTRGLAGTALPNAAAEAAGGLYTRGSGAGQINQNANGQVDTRTVATGSNAINAAGLDPDVTTELQAGLATASALSTVSGKVDTIDDFLDTEIAAILAAVDTEVAAIKAKTDNLPSDPADESSIQSTLISLASTLSTIASYIDTEVAAIKAKTDNLPASPAAVGSAMTLTSGERDSIAAALLDLSNGVETSITPRQAMRLILAASAGKLSGAGTTTITIRNVGDSKDRITATVDSSGNRSAVTTDGT